MNHTKLTREKTKQSKTNFLYSFLMMPKEKREAIYSVYAFCRHSDDIVDDIPDPQEARTTLDEWRSDLDQAFLGKAQHPILQSLTPVIQNFNIPHEHFHALIDGCEMDLTKKRYETFDELSTYCYHVASAVGLMCIEIFEYRHPSAKEYAINLGKALQLTNIMRDVQEDAMNGRVYLPQEDLARFHYTDEQLKNGDYSAEFVEMMRHQYQRAYHYYEQAMSHFHQQDLDLLFPAEIMRKIYFQLLEMMRNSNFNVFDQRMSVHKSEKGLIALTTWMLSRWSCAKKWVITPSS